MEIIKIKPQGFCKGVIKAIQILNENCDKEDMYMYGSLVHNEHIINAFKAKGIKQLNNFFDIENGTVIITAHGLSNYQRNQIKAKGLNILDTTCPEVKHIQDLIYEKERDGYSIIYFGTPKHPECKAILEDHKDIYLIESINDVNKFNIKNDKILFASQTTASYIDVKMIEDLLKVKYPTLEVTTDICTATKLRQNALTEQAKNCDMVIVVGDKKSNNTNNLLLLASSITKAIQIENIEEINCIDFTNINTLGITAGASTPNILVDEIIKKIQDNTYVSNISDNDYINI